MNKYEKIYLKAAKKHEAASWIDTAIASLAVDMEEQTGLPVTVSGPFGLRAQVTLYVGEDREQRKGRLITLTPYFPDNGFKLYYDTGRRGDRYAPGTLGDFNNLNNEAAPLPDTLEEIISLLRPIYEEEHPNE